MLISTAKGTWCPLSDVNRRIITKRYINKIVKLPWDGYEEYTISSLCFCYAFSWYLIMNSCKGLSMNSYLFGHFEGEGCCMEAPRSVQMYATRLSLFNWRFCPLSWGVLLHVCFLQSILQAQLLALKVAEPSVPKPLHRCSKKEKKQPSNRSDFNSKLRHFEGLCPCVQDLLTLGLWLCSELN